MNTIIRSVAILAMAVVTSNGVAAQRPSFTTYKGMTIGFGLGAAYQQSDIFNSRGAGFDFFLGSHLYKRQNAFLSADWKFRVLAGENKAYDHRINTDSTYSNINFGFASYDLELGFTLNRLRERTRIVFTGFAGIGITNGIISTDRLDAGGNAYDYSVIDPNAGRKQIYKDLLNLSDKEFETKIINKMAVMPTCGLYLGYQFSRSFSLGIEHKINFSLTENNSSTGINMDNRVVPGSRIDMNHYTALGFKWILGGKASRSAGASTGTAVNTPVTTNQYNTEKPVTQPRPAVTVPPPAVTITTPSGNPFSAASGTLDVIARVRNVRGKQDVRVSLNGKNIAFDYNPSSGNVSSRLTLNEGKNNLVITASNEAGSATDDLVINQERSARGNLPVVKFVNPATPVTVDKNTFSINIQTRNVKAWQDVTVNINGIKTDNFNFSPEGIVTTNIPLKEGANRVEVKAKNESGTASDIATITYTKPVRADSPGTVTADAPGTVKTNPAGTGRTNPTGTARTDPPGTVKTDPSGTGRTNPPGNVRTDPAGTVKAGPSGTTKTSPPVIQIVTPGASPFTTYEPVQEIKARITDIKGKENISISLNGNAVTGFTFDHASMLLKTSVNLKQGNNTLIITARNDAGQDTKSQVMNRENRPCPKPAVNFSLSPVGRENATHELKGTVSNVKNKSDIIITVDNAPYESFTFVPGTGGIGATFKFGPGSHMVKVAVKNDCGQHEYTQTITIDEAKPCGIRINPGNSSWEFCLVTPTGTIRRDALTNPDFRYSGPAGSLFFLPIAGGGDAVVKGKPYPIRTGQYYLFTGNLSVTVSTKNPGSMGQWSVCITADKEPVYGNGNNRPQSPCESQGEDGKQKNNGPSKDGK